MAAAAAAHRNARSALAVGATVGLRRRRDGRQRADRGAGPPRTRGDAVLCAGLGIDRDGHDVARRRPTRTRSSARSTRSTTSLGRSRRSTMLRRSSGSTSSTTTAASPRWRWRTASTRPSCTPCRPVHRVDGCVLRPSRAQGGARRRQPRATRIGAARTAVAWRWIPNPIDVSAWPLQERKDDYVLWIGRMTPEKGPHRAIAAAQAADVPAGARRGSSSPAAGVL